MECSGVYIYLCYMDSFIIEFIGRVFTLYILSGSFVYGYMYVDYVFVYMDIDLYIVLWNIY